jgi:tRNA A-37 threonylcarbamoyl transferase component Bud32
VPPLDSLRAALADRYRLDRQLGQGGMATVYLAHDLKLDRDVALKVLRPELAAVLGRDRFLGEIRLTAKLDHPHILTLIASGEDEGFLWYVLPYVRGESLRDRLTRDKQLGVEEALAITKQIAGALEYAHQHGVIHRDIKPENILLHEGEAMLADFGIALAVKEAAGNRLTETGLSLGTPQYMSPEQATGERQLDAQSDVYSLAAVLYEMLAGEPPLSGSTAQAIIAKLMTERPTRLRVIRDTVPEGIDAAVAKALAKVPADRFGGASEFAKALGAEAGGHSKDKRRVRRLVAFGGVIAFVAVAAVFLGRVGRGHTSGRFVVQDRTQVTFTGNATNPAISADGKQVAYVAKRCAAGVCTSSIELLDLGTGTTRLLVDDVAAAADIRWSHDRRFLLFTGMIGRRQGTYVVSTLGSNPNPISTSSYSATFVPGQDSLLLSLSKARDSVAWVAVATLAGEYRDSIPIHLGRFGALGEGYVWPGGRWIVMETLGNVGANQAFRHEFLSIDREGRQRDAIVVPAFIAIAFVQPDGFWMQPWTNGFPIIRVPFDSRKGRFTGPWDTVLVASDEGFDVTEDGQSAVYSDGTTEYRLWAMDVADAFGGKFSPERTLRSGTSPEREALSPNGTEVIEVHTVATGGGEGKEIDLLALPSGAELRHWAVDSVLDLEWMPDGRDFSYAERVAGQVRLITVDVKTAARQGRVEIPDAEVERFSPLSDGGWAWASGRLHIWRSGEPEARVLPLLKDEVNVAYVRASPDHLRLASLAESVTEDSGFLDVTILPDGQLTRWAAFKLGFFGRSGVWWLADGSLAVWAQKSEDEDVLYRVRGPGRVERLGAIPRALEDVSMSRDGRRIALVTREFRGDVWLAHLKRTSGN